MNISCPDCQSIFRVDPAKVTSANLRARCSVCGGLIPIGASIRWADDFPSVTTPSMPAARSPGLPAQAPVAPPERASSQPVPAAAPIPPMREGTPAGGVSLGAATPGASSRPEAYAPATTPSAPPPPPRPAPLTPTFGAPVARTVPRPLTPAFIPSTVVDESRSAPAALPSRESHTPHSVPASPARGSELLRSSESLSTPAPQRSTPAVAPFASSRIVPPAPAAPTGPGVPGAPAPRRSVNPFLANDPNQKARRLARALVSDMVAYHPRKREEGLQNGTLKQLFRDEIKKSYEEYVEQVGREFADSTAHFQDALNDVLAGGKRLF
ncbi:MAG: zinc-ribbon domain-containing protein [Gemmatimonadaceae bacterium]